ncbi:unnamed protein product [Blepharisma stoltei]|uniref:Uncharacterized protein n=1 Tax=Blepharisma stoltei TaxID=1481888 RepID=A0AAU9JUE2_9CILI|nr:unnamed protein product [Blepharisma stoltei]
MTSIRKNNHQKSKAKNSQDLPQKSLKWLLELDASEIIEVSLPDIPNTPQEFLIENIQVQNSVNFNNQIEEIYLKTAKSSKRKILTEESTQYPSINDIPNWNSLAKEIHIISTESFQWLSAIDSEGETIGIYNTCMGIHTNIPSQDIYHSILYWGSGNLDENGWVGAFRSLFYMFAHGKCEWFYVNFGRYLAFFKRENDKPVAVIANPTSQLKNALRKALVNVPEDDIEVENMPNLKNQKKNPPIKIEGKSLHQFYEYLTSNFADNRLLAPTFFLNSTLKSLNTTFNGEIKGLDMTNDSRKMQRKFKLSFEGPISFLSIKNICGVLQSTQNSFSIEIFPDTASAPLGFPSSISFMNGSYFVKRSL